MVFVETPTFTKRVLELLDDESYAKLQRHIARRPDSGLLIRNSRGLRKIRWSAKGHGKSGGVRVIYYWWAAQDRISMLLVYPKNEQDNLTAAEVKLLRRALEL